MAGGVKMNHWLLKSDPETYSFDDLQRDKKTVWDGVRNNQALIYLRKFENGDEVLMYHSGVDKAVVGLAEVVSAPYPDPKLEDPKLVVVDLKFRQRLPSPIPLAAIKADPAFADLGLVRQSRLSVMPVPDALWKKLRTMAGL
jgi:predicted RNA-binding protein with PUA-like domain